MKELYLVGLGRGGFAALEPVLKREQLQQVRCFVCSAAPPYFEEFFTATKGRRLVSLEQEAGKSRSSKDNFSFMQERLSHVQVISRLLEQEQRLALLLPGRPWPGDTLLRLLRRSPELRETAFFPLPGEDLLLPLLETIAAAPPPTGEEPYYGQGREERLPFCRGLTVFDALCGEQLQEPGCGELLISQVYNHGLLAEIAARLGHLFSAGHRAALWQFNRRGEPILLGTWTLQELCGLSGLPLHAWSFLYLPPFDRFSLGHMTEMMARLRAPGGCPWDRQQDHRSLRPYLLEESHEVLEAINSGDMQSLCEELGDLLLQIVFHSELARERGDFTLWDVIDGITRKIFRRHPHVFQQEKLADARAVSRRWQEIKLQEKAEGGLKDDPFALPPGLPALMRAQKIQKRAAAAGFDWPAVEGALEKVEEELRELKAARNTVAKGKVEEELGDLLFALVNVARFLQVDAEQALLAAIAKFARRFHYITEKVKATGKEITSFSLEELDLFWEEAKLQEKGK